jgi:hypothetical protein
VVTGADAAAVGVELGRADGDDAAGVVGEQADAMTRATMSDRDDITSRSIRYARALGSIVPRC